MRGNKEIYSTLYPKVMEAYKNGEGIDSIVKKFNLSYSCVYHWIKGLRKPKNSRLNEFFNEIKNKGPKPVKDIEEFFPKHNELFLTASKRGFPVKRLEINKRFGKYSTWYFIPGQEKKLNSEIKYLFNKYKEVLEKINESLKDINF